MSVSVSTKRRHKVGGGQKRHASKTRADVYAALWEDPKYLRLHKAKDLALHAWNVLDAYKSHPAHVNEPEKLKKADARAKRSLRRLNDYEDAAMKKNGLTS